MLEAHNYEGREGSCSFREEGFQALTTTCSFLGMMHRKGV